MIPKTTREVNENSIRINSRGDSGWGGGRGILFECVVIGMVVAHWALISTDNSIRLKVCVLKVMSFKGNVLYKTKVCVSLCESVVKLNSNGFYRLSVEIMQLNCLYVGKLSQLES